MHTNIIETSTHASKKLPNFSNKNNKIVIKLHKKSIISIKKSCLWTTTYEIWNKQTITSTILHKIQKKKSKWKTKNEIYFTSPRCSKKIEFWSIYLKLYLRLGEDDIFFSTIQCSNKGRIIVVTRGGYGPPSCFKFFLNYI